MATYYTTHPETNNNNKIIIVFLILALLLLFSIFRCSAQTYKVTSYANELFNSEEPEMYYPINYETTRFVFDFGYKEVRINSLVLEIDEMIDETTMICIDANTDEIYVIGVDEKRKEITVYYNKQLVAYYF